MSSFPYRRISRGPDPFTYSHLIHEGEGGVRSLHMEFGATRTNRFLDNNRREFFRYWSLVTGRQIPEHVVVRTTIGWLR